MKVRYIGGSRFTINLHPSKGGRTFVLRRGDTVDSAEIGIELATALLKRGDFDTADPVDPDGEEA